MSTERAHRGRPGGGAGAALHDLMATATGADHRDDPAAPRTGGPAGNARLTAWTGLLLLALFLVECFTLISVRGMISVHILVGALLVPVVLLKTATTGWRIGRYYLGSETYRQAGPPPLLLRVLGPLVVLTGLAVLGSGLALIALGSATFTSIGTVAGMRIDALTVHQASFIAWLAVNGLHVLARTVPAIQLTSGRTSVQRPLPGATGRGTVLLATAVAGVIVGVAVLHLSGDWTSGKADGFRHKGDRQSAPR